MYDIPNNNENVRSLLEACDKKYDKDAVILDLTTLYKHRPTFNNLPTSLGIIIPSDMDDIFDTVFIRAMIEAVVEHGIYSTNIEQLITYVEDTINESLRTTYTFNMESSSVLNYIAKFHSLLNELIERYMDNHLLIGSADSYYNIGVVDKFYTISDLNIYINNDKAKMQLVLNIWTQSKAWN